MKGGNTGRVGREGGQGRGWAGRCGRGGGVNWGLGASSSCSPALLIICWCVRREVVVAVGGGTGVLCESMAKEWSGALNMGELGGRRRCVGRATAW